jgi:hypothetical protein
MKNLNNIVNEIVTAAVKTVDLGPGVVCSIKTTKDEQGFEINIKGTFRSGDPLEETVKQLQDFWKKLDIDA